MIKKVDSNAQTSLKVGSGLAYQEKVSYTCKNDPDEKYSLDCSSLGKDLSVTCLSKSQKPNCCLDLVGAQFKCFGV